MVWREHSQGVYLEKIVWEKTGCICPQIHLPSIVLMYYFMIWLEGEGAQLGFFLPDETLTLLVGPFRKGKVNPREC